MRQTHPLERNLACELVPELPPNPLGDPILPRKGMKKACKRLKNGCTPSCFSTSPTKCRLLQATLLQLAHDVLHDPRDVFGIDCLRCFAAYIGLAGKSFAGQQALDLIRQLAKGLFLRG